MVGNGSVELSGKTSDNIIGEAQLHAHSMIDVASNLSTLRDGVVGNDSSAVFFTQGTTGPGEYVFTFSSSKMISRIRFFQDDEYVATSYRITADTNNDSMFDT